MHFHAVIPDHFTNIIVFLLPSEESTVSMGKDEFAHRKHGLLKNQVRIVKRNDSDRYEVAPIPDNLSFEKGFFAVVRACQLLAQKNEGLILIGVAGPSGAGKTVFTEKILNFMPSIAVISMDNYNDASRIIDGNFDGIVHSFNFTLCSLVTAIWLGFLLYVEFSTGHHRTVLGVLISDL